MFNDVLHVRVPGKSFLYPRYGPVKANQNQPNNSNCKLLLPHFLLSSPIVLQPREESAKLVMFTVGIQEQCLKIRQT